MPRLHSLSQVNDISTENALDTYPTLDFPDIPREENGIQFFGGKCTVRVANQLELRQEAYKLIYDIYSKTGLTRNNSNGLWLTIYDALPATTTLVAEDIRGKIGGAITLVFDSAIGLPADELYKEEIDKLRDTGRPICEFISLGVNKTAKNALRVLAGLYYCAFLYARQKKESCESVITVHPRSEKFYCRNFSFEKMGPERNYAKVNGASAILLNLSLVRLGRLRHDTRIFPFYMLKYSDQEEQEIIKTIDNLAGPMSDEEFFTFFIEKTDTWAKASLQQKNFIKSVYPIDEANHYGVSRALARASSKKNRYFDADVNDTTILYQR